jgi:hypothetical protein
MTRRASLTDRWSRVAERLTLVAQKWRGGGHSLRTRNCPFRRAKCAFIEARFAKHASLCELPLLRWAILSRVPLLRRRPTSGEKDEASHLGVGAGVVDFDTRRRVRC